jgi:hypothetical protein
MSLTVEKFRETGILLESAGELIKAAGGKLQSGGIVVYPPPPIDPPLPDPFEITDDLQVWNAVFSSSNGKRKQLAHGNPKNPKNGKMPWGIEVNAKGFVYGHTLTEAYENAINKGFTGDLRKRKEDLFFTQPEHNAISYFFNEVGYPTSCRKNHANQYLIDVWRKSIGEKKLGPFPSYVDAIESLRVLFGD